jgi:ribonuclease D
LEALRIWRKNTARRMGVNSDVVLPRDLMHALAKCQPNGTGEVEAALAETPWRRAHFGGEILAVLRNPRVNLG